MKTPRRKQDTRRCTANNRCHMENTNPQRTCKELVQEKNKDKQPKAPKSVEINERVMRIEKSNEQGGMRR